MQRRTAPWSTYEEVLATREHPDGSVDQLSVERYVATHRVVQYWLRMRRAPEGTYRNGVHLSGVFVGGGWTKRTRRDALASWDETGERYRAYEQHT